jgi:hypothetical protein
MTNFLKTIAPTLQFWLIATVVWTPLAVIAADAAKAFAAGVIV